MSGSGYIKLYRCLANSYIYTDSKAVHLWLNLLIKATKNKTEIMHGNERITLNPGELIASRGILAKETGIEESKIERLLKLFQKNGQITQTSNTRHRIISITKWNEYQEDTRNKKPKNPDQPNLFSEIKVEKPKKNKYGKYEKVLLTEEQHELLKQRFGDYLEEKIEALDYYIYQTAKKYKDHYAVILNWDRRDKQRAGTKNKFEVDKTYKELNKGRANF